MKHTPGPWLISGKETLMVCTEKMAAIAEVWSPKDRMEADASLIAAAPALLEVARASRELVTLLIPIFKEIDSATDTAYVHGMKNIIDVLSTVIKKAEGE